MLLAISATGVCAADDDLRSWADRPIAYFLTPSELERWNTLTSDEQRRELARNYLESRGENFQKVVLSRIELADRLFTVPSRPGSETLRGRIFIMLGPPTRLERLQLPLGGRPDEPEIHGIYTNVGPLGGGALSMSNGRALYRFSYRRGELSWVDGLPRWLEIELTLDLRTGRENLGASMTPSELRRILTAVAEASLPR